MFKRKCKFLFILVTLFILVSSFSLATTEPRVSEDGNDIMPISENTPDNTQPISEDVSDENTTFEPEIVYNDLYLASDKLEIDQLVDGNVYAFANEVVVKGEIAGNLFICANKVTFEESAYIYSSLFVVASDVNISGYVCDVYAFANKFTLNTNAYIGRDLNVSANTINLNGLIRRDAHLNAATYNIFSKNENLIGGNLEYSSTTKLDIPEGIVGGEIKYNEEVVHEERVIEKVFDYIFDAINGLVYTFVVILLALWLAPKFVNRVSNMDTKKAFISLGIGIVSPLVILLSLMLLVFSHVASLVSVSAIFLFIAICMSGTAFASIYFGSLLTKLAKWNGKLKFVLASLISSLAIWAISQMPYIGGLFGFLVALFGIGTLFVNAVYRKEIETEKVDQEIKE